MDPKFEIEFDNPSKLYHPGESLTGRIIIIPASSKTVIFKCITVRLEGKRTCTAKRKQPEDFYFFERQLRVINEETPLPNYEALDLPFQFQLPQSLPSSFQFHKGQIAYYLTVQCRRKQDFDLTHTSTFTVSGLYPLLTSNSGPVERQRSKPVGLCSCLNWRQGHRVGVSLKLPKDQFLPGESIDYTVKVWNSTPSNLHNASVQLIMEVRFLDSGNYRIAAQDTIVLRTLMGPSLIRPREKLVWTSIPQTEESLLLRKPPLIIPEDSVPSNLGCRGVAQLDYFVQVFLQTSSTLCSTSLECKCPVLIGTSFI